MNGNSSICRARTLEPRPQRFLLRFFADPAGKVADLIREIELEAIDASSAIAASASTPWPPRARALRILDGDGREIFERLKADRF